MRASHSSTDYGPDPFSTEADAAAFYVTTSLKQRLELVLHLAEFGRQIIILTGTAQAGKSALLEHLAANLGANSRVVKVTAGPTLNPATLLTRVAAEIGANIDGEESQAGKVDAIRARLVGLARAGRYAVLMIDDAHALPMETAALLTTLTQGNDIDRELRVIMAADPNLSSLVEQLQRDSEHQGLIHVVELPRVAAGEVREFLAHRWRAAGRDEPLPFSDRELSDIYAQANGVAGKITVLARQSALRPKRRPRRGRELRPVWMIVAAAAGLTVLATLVLLRDESPAPEVTAIALDLSPAVGPPTSNPADPPADPHPEVWAQTFRREPVAPSTMKDERPAEASRAPLAPPSEARFPASEPAPVTNENTAADPAAATKPPPAASAVVVAPPSAPSVAATAPPARPLAATTVAETPAAEYSIEWLRRQPPGGYVLQLFGVRDHAAAAGFIAKHTLAAVTIIYETSMDRRRWFVVLYGYYPDRDSARAAIASLPKALVENQPWARPIAGFGAPN